jgi:SOS regulatory protein LexA
MLTKRQKEILDFILEHFEQKEYAPSLEEICKKFRLASVSTAHFHISRLRDLGYLAKEENKPRAIDVIGRERLVRIPFMGTIAAGRPIEAIQERETIAVPISKLHGSNSIYALRVIGNSMIDENINDGDVILVKQQEFAENGQKVVALIDNYEATLKKYYREKGRVCLQPANKNIEPIILRKGQDFTIQGVVLDVIKAFPDAEIGPSVIDHNGTSSKIEQIETFVNKVVEGDCLEVMKKIPSRSIDMILCDLPYGTTQNRWDSTISLEQLWRHYERIIKNNGVIALTAQGLFTANLMLSNSKLFKYKITWVKSKPTNFLNAKKQPLRRHEDICIFYKNQPMYNPQMSNGEPYNKGFRKNQLTGSYGNFKTVEVKSNGERYPTDVIYFKTAESEGEVYHPTQKPIALGRYLVRTYTKPGDIVLDNACGSGSFLVAALLEGRRFIGIEKNREVYLHKKHRADYIAVCKTRIDKARHQRKVMSDTLF